MFIIYNLLSRQHLFIPSSIELCSVEVAKIWCKQSMIAFVKTRINGYIRQWNRWIFTYLTRIDQYTIYMLFFNGNEWSCSINLIVNCDFGYLIGFFVFSPGRGDGIGVWESAKTFSFNFFVDSLRVGHRFHVCSSLWYQIWIALERNESINNLDYKLNGMISTLNYVIVTKWEHFWYIFSKKK